MKIGVFCSANQQLAPEIFEKTRNLGQWMAKEGHMLVYGGVNSGLMECIAEVVHKSGGRTIGIIPRIVQREGRISQYVDIEIMCDNLNDRKQLMEDQSDVFIALPGGIGTLDEIFTMAASATIGFHQKRVILYNIGGFWNSLIAMLDHLQASGVIRKEWQTYIQVANSLDDIKELLSES